MQQTSYNNEYVEYRVYISELTCEAVHYCAHSVGYTACKQQSETGAADNAVNNFCCEDDTPAHTDIKYKGNYLEYLYIY